jgi:hypothetical protein
MGAAEGVGEADAAAEADGDGVGLALAEADGEGEGEADADGEGEGVVDGDGDGLGEADADGFGVLAPARLPDVEGGWPIWPAATLSGTLFPRSAAMMAGSLPSMPRAQIPRPRRPSRSAS